MTEFGPTEAIITRIKFKDGDTEGVLVRTLSLNPDRLTYEVEGNCDHDAVIKEYREQAAKGMKQ